MTENTQGSATGQNQNQAGQLLADGYFGLQGQLALITGASSGLGRHFAEVLAAAGCTVAIAARRRDRLDALAREIESNGGQALVLEMDVTNTEMVEQALAELRRQAGVVSILVNNAGSADTRHFIDAQDSDTAAIFALNQTAVWQLAQRICKQMIAHETAGSIINIASIAGIRTLGGAASYSVSKAAVVQMTKVMAMELARYHIRVNALAPGYIETELNADFLASKAGQKLIDRCPMRRTGKPQELDAALLMLASARGAYISGAVIPVDGGHLVSSM